MELEEKEREGVTQGVPLDIAEETSTIEVVEEEVKPEIENTRNGMTGNLLGQAEGADHRMNRVIIVPVVKPKEGAEEKNHQATIPKDSLKQKRETGVLAWTEIIEERGV